MFIVCVCRVLPSPSIPTPTAQEMQDIVEYMVAGRDSLNLEQVREGTKSFVSPQYVGDWSGSSKIRLDGFEETGWPVLNRSGRL